MEKYIEEDRNRIHHPLIVIWHMKTQMPCEANFSGHRQSADSVN